MQQSDPPTEIVVVPVHLDSLGRRVGELLSQIHSWSHWSRELLYTWFYHPHPSTSIHLPTFCNQLQLAGNPLHEFDHFPRWRGSWPGNQLHGWKILELPWLDPYGNRWKIHENPIMAMDGVLMELMMLAFARYLGATAWEECAFFASRGAIMLKGHGNGPSVDLHAFLLGNMGLIVGGLELIWTVTRVYGRDI